MFDYISCPTLKKKQKKNKTKQKQMVVQRVKWVWDPLVYMYT